MASLLLVIIYLAFVSLGLPDSLLGSAWPSMYTEFGVPVSYAGIISMIIALGTVITSLMSDRITIKLGAGRVTAISVATTAAALLGFGLSHSFWLICLIAIPYGLGAGSIDAALNNYVALHYASRHMSWLHCMWGIGASVGPCIMGLAIAHNNNWSAGYRYISYIQIVLTFIVVISLPLWKKRGGAKDEASDGACASETARAVPLREIFRIPGAKAIMLAFFCYSAIEQTTGLWASSYLVFVKGIPAQTAASFAALFYIGITAGRAVNGFLTFRLSDRQLIFAGSAVIAIGILALTLPFGNYVSLGGFIMIGLGCAPIYPCIIHSTPDRFGKNRSAAIIGVEMASAYIGTCLMPPLFGLLPVSFLPFYLIFALAVMTVMNLKLNGNKKTAANT